MLPAPHLDSVVAQAAGRLNLILGRDRVWRGQCPACGYAKPTLTMKVDGCRIAVSCAACGSITGIAATMGLPADLITAPKPKPSNVARAVDLWNKAAPAQGTLVDQYLKDRSITVPIPPSLRFLERQRSWADREFYPAMISLVQRVPGEDDQTKDQLVSAGGHLTFLARPDSNEVVQKADTEANKLTLGQLRHGAVWLTPFGQIGNELAVAEGIETALSVMQMTGLPTVAALSAAGMRSFRWPNHIRQLWIAADNDPVGRKAAEVLLERALRAGLKAQIKIPAQGQNDFNDLLRISK